MKGKRNFHERKKGTKEGSKQKGNIILRLQLFVSSVRNFAHCLKML